MIVSFIVLETESNKKKRGGENEVGALMRGGQKEIEKYTESSSIDTHTQDTHESYVSTLLSFIFCTGISYLYTHIHNNNVRVKEMECTKLVRQL